MSSEDAATRVIERPSTVELRPLQLQVIDGPDKGKNAVLPVGIARVGTAAGCHLRLTDPTVSRLHLEIISSTTGHRLTDLESRNGTFIDSVRVYKADVEPGATLRVGETTIRVVEGEDSVFVQISNRTSFGNVIGASLEMRRTYVTMERAAPTDATVLLGGETGTGKELAARELHRASRRASGPFVAVDCGAIAENLIESELFGHTRGAFSGAVSERKGLIASADGGTLFLDEIGELPLALQPRLLRVLEEREVRRVGENVSRKVDFRLIAATNRSLAERVNSGDFREDLYYRLAVVNLTLPALRHRREDIPALVRHFVKQLSERFGATDTDLPDEVMRAMQARAWPGNIRELRNAVERSMALGWAHKSGALARETVATVAPTALKDFVPTDLPLKQAREVWLAQFERLYAEAVLQRASGNVTRAAELAGVHRRSLQRLIAGSGLRDEDDE